MTRQREYDCDRCGQEVADGNGYYLADDRVCRDCSSDYEMTADERTEIRATLEHALAQPPETLQRLLGEFLMKLNPPID
jgi:recombinational DNA repair protein (RecF pathway)